MQLSKRVIQSAKEQALFGFSMLAQNIVADAQDDIRQAMTEHRTREEHKALTGALQLLRFESARFAERIQAFYRDYLDRAMQTMYTDLRAGLHDMSADNLSLIDDDTINRQIEVDRLVLRMRDIDRESLGRLNIMIAQLHGSHDVRERENPFRPYLLARSLHEVLASMEKDDAAGKVLFEMLSNAMLNRLPGFYAAIREVFESNGVHSRLLARPGSMSYGQRVQQARQAAQSGLPTDAAGASERGIFSDMRRLQAIQEKMSAPSASDGAPDSGQRAAAFQDFVWQMFHQQKPAAAPRQSGSAEAGTPGRGGAEQGAAALMSALGDFQKAFADGDAADGDRARLAALREKIDSAKLSDMERIAVDVVSLLFDAMAKDELVAAEVRPDIVRLTVPFLKAVIITPELLRQQQHPARLFLNRIGTLAAAIDPQQPADQRIAAEIHDATGKLLERFERDVAVFTAVREELDQALHEVLRAGQQASMQACIDAVEDAERESVVLFNTANTVNDLLPAVHPDPRVAGFITQTWVRVLARLFCRDAARHSRHSQGARQSAPDPSLHASLRKVLPELIWSAQPKLATQDRAALMRLLPELAKRLKAGLALLGLPDDDIKRALDQLVEVHMQVLRSAAGNSGNTSQPAMSIDELYQHFALLSVCEGSYLWTEDEPLKVPAAIVQAAFAEHGAAARLQASDEPIPAMATDAVWLAQMQPGLGVEMLVNGSHAAARLEWASSQRALFVFRARIDPTPVVYSSVSLLKALRDGSLRMLEHASLFDRAVETLMINAEALPAAG
jgi:hypothetical protein